MFQNFAGRIRQDCMNKLIQQAQNFITEKVTNFDTNSYIKKSQLIIHEYKESPIQNQNKTHKYHNQQNEYFPPTLGTVEALKLFNDRLPTQSFQNIACEIINSCMRQLVQVAEKYKEKFDAFLFLAKNLILLSETVLSLKLDFVKKEQEIDFSDTKNQFKNILSGNINYNFNFSDVLKADTLWNYATSIFNFLYKSFPKVNEFTIDFKKNLINQTEMVFNNMNQDMTFIISKSLIDFIRKFQYLSEQQNKLKESQSNLENQISILKHNIEDSEDQQAEIKLNQKQLDQTRKELQQYFNDINLLMNKEFIQKTYILFIDNLKEISALMIYKLKNFVNQELFDKLIQHIYEIQQNCLDLLSQFYIIISKYYDQEQYNLFNFTEYSQLRQQLTLINNNCIEGIENIQ